VSAALALPRNQGTRPTLLKTRVTPKMKSQESFAILALFFLANFEKSNAQRVALSRFTVDDSPLTVSRPRTPVSLAP